MTSNPLGQALKWQLMKLALFIFIKILVFITCPLTATTYYLRMRDLRPVNGRFRRKPIPDYNEKILRIGWNSIWAMPQCVV